MDRRDFLSQAAAFAVPALPADTPTGAGLPGEFRQVGPAKPRLRECYLWVSSSRDLGPQWVPRGWMGNGSPGNLYGQIELQQDFDDDERLAGGSVAWRKYDNIYDAFVRVPWARLRVGSIFLTGVPDAGSPYLGYLVGPEARFVVWREGSVARLDGLQRVVRAAQPLPTPTCDVSEVYIWQSFERQFHLNLLAT